VNDETMPTAAPILRVHPRDHAVHGDGGET
jgi:hypothetical protein